MTNHKMLTFIQWMKKTNPEIIQFDKPSKDRFKILSLVKNRKSPITLIMNEGGQ